MLSDQDLVLVTGRCARRERGIPSLASASRGHRTRCYPSSGEVRSDFLRGSPGSAESFMLRITSFTRAVFFCFQILPNLTIQIPSSGMDAPSSRISSMSYIRGVHQYWCDAACMARIIRTKTNKLLVGAEEVVVGGVRYQRLLTDVGERRASGSRSGSSLCI